ncbi:MAG: class I SAM-dependent methyltransferase [Cyanobacteria bacterium J06641_5]
MNNLYVKEIVGDTPFMGLSKANRITAFMDEHKVRNILELGFAHGVSTAYMAAALRRSGGGAITSIDREEARQREPNIETLLARVGASDSVQIFYEPTSYVWRLMKDLYAIRGPDSRQ